MTFLALAALSPLAHAGTWPVDDGPQVEAWRFTDNGVEAQDLAIGTGPTVVDGATVKVHYTGILSDGTVFDSSVPRETLFSFRVGAHQVIPGWEEGVIGMAVGGKRRLIIPSHLGYGQQSAGPIPPGSTLYFEIELFELVMPRVAPTAPQTVDASQYRTTRSGLQIADLTLGDGARPKEGRRVCVDYTVWVDDTKLLDHTFAKQQCRWFRYDHSPVPEGLVEGLAKMREGGTRQLRVPSNLLDENEAFPPDTTVLYEVTLVTADD